MVSFGTTEATRLGARRPRNCGRVLYVAIHSSARPTLSAAETDKRGRCVRANQSGGTSAVSLAILFADAVAPPAESDTEAVTGGRTFRRDFVHWRRHVAFRLCRAPAGCTTRLPAPSAEGEPRAVVPPLFASVRLNTAAGLVAKPAAAADPTVARTSRHTAATSLVGGPSARAPHDERLLGHSAPLLARKIHPTRPSRLSS